MDSRITVDDLQTMVVEVEKRYPNELEYQHAVKEVLQSLIPLMDNQNLKISKGAVELLIEPERLIQFRIPWIDDKGVVRVNRGYRVQFNSALGPYKGGIRFHPSVNASIIKFLGFEQTFKNALTGLPLGGGKGGADFDPKDKSDAEILRFCQSFMTELVKYLGPHTDIPAGDIGVGAREVGYMFGQYKRIKTRFDDATITGKPLIYGGSLARKEATGYGLVYFLKEMLTHEDISLAGKKVIVSGAGNVALYAIEKLQQLGANVIACSDSKGYIYAEDGLILEDLKLVKESQRGCLSAYARNHPNTKYVTGGNIWEVPCDIALPCATQNELHLKDAQLLVKHGVIAVAEGANMPTTAEAIAFMQKQNVLFAPGKAANAGGVAVSGLEMSQNSMRLKWSFEEVDEKLKIIMQHIYQTVSEAAITYGHSGNLVIGANIAGFLKVTQAMKEQGYL